jgi:hypothetical protein
VVDYPKDERYSPAWWFKTMGLTFDMDVCDPYAWKKLPGYAVPAKNHLTQRDGGLRTAWSGLVWMNPPFGGRNDIVPWLEKFVEHGNGVGCCWGRTASGWFQDFMPQMQRLVFLRNKKQFVYPNGELCGCAKDGVVLFAKGIKGVTSLGEFSQYGLITNIVERHP